MEGTKPRDNGVIIKVKNEQQKAAIMKTLISEEREGNFEKFHFNKSDNYFHITLFDSPSNAFYLGALLNAILEIHATH